MGELDVLVLKQERNCVSNMRKVKVRRGGPEGDRGGLWLTVNRRCSLLIATARRLLARAAWWRLARVLGGTSADRGGVYMGVLRGKGARVLNQNPRISTAITLKNNIVFDSVCLGGMTSGVALSVTEGGRR
jgi:hypothetical protein